MILGMPFRVFVSLVFILALLSQVYLFFRIRSAVLASRMLARRKIALLLLLAGIMVLLYGANAYFVFRSVPWTDPPRAAQYVFFYLPAVWSLGAIFSALLLFCTQLCGWAWRLASRLIRFGDGPTHPGPVAHDRRRFLRAAVGGLASAPFLVTAYGAFSASEACEVSELTLSFGRSLRVVQLTDIHAGLHMSRKEMRQLADRVNALEPDVCVLTGDYITNSMQFLAGCVEEMAKIRAGYGTFASMGNHDLWFAGASRVESVFRANGIPLLMNAHRVIQTPRGPFAIAGIDDLLHGAPDLGAALRGLSPGVPTMLLSHRPEVFPEAAARGVRLTLSGHYHGGQVRMLLPGGSTSFADLRTPYPRGLFQKQDSYLYVSRGIGTTFIPVRINAPPEITLLTLI